MQQQPGFSSGLLRFAVRRSFLTPLRELFLHPFRAVLLVGHKNANPFARDFVLCQPSRAECLPFYVRISMICTEIVNPSARFTFWALVLLCFSVRFGAVFAPLPSGFAGDLEGRTRPTRNLDNPFERFAWFCCPKVVFYAKWSTLSHGILCFVTQPERFDLSKVCFRQQS